MKSIERSFQNIQKKNSQWSSYVCFKQAIRGKKYTDRSVREAFHKYVHKDDYDENDKKYIIAELQEITKGLEDNQNGGK